jgi:UPF0716 protein FxsA
MMKIPFRLLFLLFVLAEIAAFILVGGAIGVLPTLGLVVAGMLGGVALLRWSGLALLRRTKAEFDAGRRPAPPLVEGALLGAAALLIMLPGFVSDVIGIALLVPAVRRGVRRVLGRRFAFLRPRPAAERGSSAPVIDLQRGEYDRQVSTDSPWRR